MAQPCRFYNSKSGCRSGTECRFAHVNTDPMTKDASASSSTQPAAHRKQSPMPVTDPLQESSSKIRAVPPTTKPVSRPLPKAQMDDPRGFQLGQLRRRYPGMKASETDQATVVTFDLMPSDPDFPYTMDSLACKMMIPLTFPKSSPPTLRVTNPDMKRGFQLNVENGFDEIISNAPNATLLTVMNRLDRSLADLLARPMMDTIKIQPNNATRDISASATASVVHAQVRVDPIVSQPEPSIADKERAKTKRQTDIRQLVSRLGKLPKFKQSVDGISFTIPFTPARKAEVPPSLVNLETICLIVPELYNLQPCRIDIPGNKDESFQNVERSFEEHCRAHPSTTLLAQINYLTQHLATMAKKKVMGGPSVPIQAPPSMPVGPSIPVPSRSTDSQQTILIDRPHVQIIPRPPEWSQQDDESSDSGGDDSSDEGVENTASDDDGKEDDGGVPTTLDLSSRGIIVSLPGLELHGIELLELDTLSLTVKCERCKTQVDVEKLRNEVAKSTDCTKCGNRIDATFRKDLMHINANRAGSVDTAGAIITDMLPSAFVPTCSGCSTRHATPPCLAVRGDTTVAFCRECHQKMSFRLPEVRFMLASLTNEKRSRVVARKQPKEQLGIVAGQELPRRGRCKHYTKSYRWFRFSCCAKVYPCDRCHDEDQEHPNEHANRMLCGYCSREQNYRPEDCGICHSNLTAKKGKGFWEGGKGTRDPLRMSRKDPRKFKRRPGTAPKTT